MLTQEQVEDFIKRQLPNRSVFGNLATSNSIIEDGITIFPTNSSEKYFAIVITEGKGKLTTRSKPYYAIRLIDYKVVSGKLTIISIKRFPVENNLVKGKGYSTLEDAWGQARKVISEIINGYVSLEEPLRREIEELKKNYQQVKLELEQTNSFISALQTEKAEINNQNLALQGQIRSQEKVNWRLEKDISTLRLISEQELTEQEIEIEQFREKNEKIGQYLQVVEQNLEESERKLEEKIKELEISKKVIKEVTRYTLDNIEQIINQNQQKISRNMENENWKEKNEEFTGGLQKKWDEFFSDTENMLDNYHELLGTLKKIKKSKLGTVNKTINDLRSKVKKFLKEYDKDNNGAIDITELVKSRLELATDLSKEKQNVGGSQLGDIVLAMKTLEDKIIEYQQGCLLETVESESDLEANENQAVEEAQVLVEDGQQIQAQIEVLPK
jgi:hypothetical protein